MLGPQSRIAIRGPYAGTGAIGIEAISRGAREAILVESHADGGAAHEANLEVARDSDAEVIEADAVAG